MNTDNPDAPKSEAENQSGSSQDLDYTEAPGSGAAAVLAFIHIGVVGVIGYGAYYLLTHAQPGLLLSPLLTFQYLLPVCLGLALFFPTDPLTRTLALTARIAGFVGLAALIVAFVLAMGRSGSLPESEDIPLGILPAAVVLLAHLSAAWLAAVCIGEALRSNLAEYTGISLSEFLSGLLTLPTALIVVGAIGIHLFVDYPSGGLSFGTILIALLGIPACRLAAYASVRRASRRPGSEPSVHTPLMFAAALAILVLAYQPLASKPLLAGLFVGSGLWAILPYLSWSRLERSAPSGNAQ